MKLIKPCEKCPYKLGIIQTFVNPWPSCRLNDYKTYEVFIEQMQNGVGTPGIKNEELPDKLQSKVK